MVREVLDTLYGNGTGDSLYDVSYQYALRDFEGLLKYRKNGYEPERIVGIIEKERKKLKNQYALHRLLKSTDGLLNTDSEKYRNYLDMYREAVKYYRYASLRDKGVVRQKDETKRFKKELKEKFLKYGDFGADGDLNCLFQPEVLAKICGELAGLGDREAAYLHSEIVEFITVCPEPYLRRGIFAKYVGSLFGVMKFNYRDPEIDYLRKIRTGSWYGTTYLFDEIIDDRAYSAPEKEAYYRNISQILKSSKGEETTFSHDPLMACTEHALIGLREMLPPDRWNPVAKSYSVIADASVKGSEWTHCHSLSDEDIYVHAVLKGAYTRIIPAILAGCTITGRFMAHCLRSGYIFQLPDDLRDIPDDVKNGNVTAFNYYPNGANRLQYHPIDILLTAIARTSYVDYPEMKDACNLYMTCVFQSLKALRTKNTGADLCAFFTDMQFPDDDVTRQLCRTARYSCMVTDFETELAGKCTLAALDMKKTA